MCLVCVFWQSACRKARVHQCIAYPSVFVRLHVNLMWTPMRHCMRCLWVFLSCVYAALEHSHLAEVIVKRWEQTWPLEEKGLAGRQQDIPSHYCCCTHFLQLFPAAGSMEVRRGQASSSLCHYPFVTCRPFCTQSRTFSSVSSTFTLDTSLSSLWFSTLLFLLTQLCLYDFTIFLLPICSLPPFLSLLLVSFCSFCCPVASTSFCHFFLT